jgi:hypothetical protein
MQSSGVSAERVAEAVAGRLAELRERMVAAVARGGHGQAVTLIAVTKTHPADVVDAAFEAGIRDVGENRVQEAMAKRASVQSPVAWHLIGHLQRNKAVAALDFVCFHGLDSERLAVALHEAADQRERFVDVCIQVNVSGEASKSGFAVDEVPVFAERAHALPRLRVRGVMTMAPLAADVATLRHVFSGARAARAVVQAAGHDAPWLSMGMSNDFEAAIEEGATHVRIGSALFGDRP